NIGAKVASQLRSTARGAEFETGMRYSAWRVSPSICFVASRAGFMYRLSIIEFKRIVQPAAGEPQLSRDREYREDENEGCPGQKQSHARSRRNGLAFHSRAGR